MIFIFFFTLQQIFYFVSFIFTSIVGKWKWGRKFYIVIVRFISKFNFFCADNSNNAMMKSGSSRKWIKNCEIRAHFSLELLLSEVKAGYNAMVHFFMVILRVIHQQDSPNRGYTFYIIIMVPTTSKNPKQIALWVPLDQLQFIL